MRKVLTLALLCSAIGLSTGCTTGQVAAGAVGAGAGYVIGRESKD